MEFGEKIKKLRSQSNLTQEGLANKLYVSRTAVSKWESGKGYPNIDLLKDIARLFNVTIDELLSSEEILDIAKKESYSNVKKINIFICGLLDVISILFILLPIYAHKTDAFIYSVPLFNANGIGVGIKISYTVILSILSLIGLAEIALNFIDFKRLHHVLSITSVAFQVISILFFALTRQAYLTSIVFIILVIKVLLMLKAMAKTSSCH